MFLDGDNRRVAKPMNGAKKSYKTSHTLGVDVVANGVANCLLRITTLF